MKKKFIKVILLSILISIIAIVLVVIFSINTPTIADVGSFDRYDSGGSDWGSSSWSSSDWGSSSSSDWDWGSSSSSSDGSLGFILGILFSDHPILTIMIIIFITIMVNISKKNRRRPRNIPTYNISRNMQNSFQNNNPTVNPSNSAIYAQKVIQIDPLFSEEKFLSWSKNLFIKLQNAWTARDWEPMRPFETEELFDQHKNQVQGYIDTHRINIMDRIAVNYAYLYGFRQEGGRDILEVALKSTMKDYIVKEDTKEVLEGNPNQDRITVYKLTFERKTGVLTKEGEIEVNTTNCPNCGTPTSITSSGRCEYCRSIITTRDYGWVLSSLEPLR